MIPDYNTFLNTLIAEKPKTDWPDCLQALWYDAKNDWHSAHDIVDGMNDAIAKWVHAYLHRKEGDDWNAGYWYRQSSRPFPKVTLDEEFREIVEFILNQD